MYYFIINAVTKATVRGPYMNFQNAQFDADVFTAQCGVEHLVVSEDRNKYPRGY